MNEQGCTRMESKNNDWKRMKEKEWIEKDDRKKHERKRMERKKKDEKNGKESKRIKKGKAGN